MEAQVVGRIPAVGLSKGRQETGETADEMCMCGTELKQGIIVQAHLDAVEFAKELHPR